MIGSRLRRVEKQVHGRGLHGDCGSCGGVHRGWRGEARRHLREQLAAPDPEDARDSCECDCCAAGWLANAVEAVADGGAVRALIADEDERERQVADELDELTAAGKVESFPGWTPGWYRRAVEAEIADREHEVW